MAGQRQDRLRAARRWGAALSLALVMCVAWPVARGMAQDPGQGERQRERLICVHPFDPAHPVVTGFLAPWAHGVSVDSGGALGVEVRAAPLDAGAACALAPLSGPTAEALALPFVAPRASEDASAAAWTADAPGAPPGRLALVVDGPGALIVTVPEARPLPGSLQGLAVRVPSEGVGRVLAELGAAFVLAPPGTGTKTGTVAAVVPLSGARDAAWLVPIGGDRSLHGLVYALEVAPGYLATLDAATRATLTRDRGLALSRSAGRAIDRSAAVTLEAFQNNGRAVPLAEDAVGQLLSGAAAIRADWAVTVQRERLLDRLGGVARVSP